MSKIITLPSGNTVVLRDPSTLKQKDRVKVAEAANGKDGLLIGLAMTDGLISVLVESWSLDLIIPSIHLASLGELSMPDYDALANEANNAQTIIFPNQENGDNPDSPKENLNA